METETRIIVQLLLALFLCGSIGLERELKNKGAGLQTYSLVGLAAAAFTILAVEVGTAFNNLAASLPVVGTIITCVAIICAGVIFRSEKGVEGITTAVGLWAVSSVGISVGLQQYFLATAITLFILFIMVTLGLLEKDVISKKRWPL